MLNQANLTSLVQDIRERLKTDRGNNDLTIIGHILIQMHQATGLGNRGFSVFTGDIPSVSWIDSCVGSELGRLLDHPIPNSNIRFVASQLALMRELPLFPEQGTQQLVGYPDSVEVCL